MFQAKLLFALHLLLPACLLSQTGDPDFGFGRNGLAATRLPGKPSGPMYTKQLISHPDGSWFGLVSHKPGLNTVFKLRPDGQVDRSYGLGGFAEPVSMDAYAIAFTSDGKLLMAGMEKPVFRIQNDGPWRDAAIVQYKPNGRLDETFGKAGKVLQEAGGNEDEEIFSMAVQPDGKILLAGRWDLDLEASQPYLARFEMNGKLDHRFELSIGDPRDQSGVLKVVPTANGRLLALITSEDFDDGTPSFSLVALNPNGSIDAGFGSEGKVQSATGVRAVDMALAPDSSITVATTRSMRNDGDDVTLTEIVRFTPDGKLDTQFGNEGVLQLSWQPNLQQLQQILWLPSGRLLLVGSSRTTTGVPFSLAFWRHLSNGAPDLSFGNKGSVVTGVAETPSGTVVSATGGWVSAGSTLHAYTGDGQPNVRFGSAGKQAIRLNYADLRFTSSALTADGKLVAAGATENDGEQGIGIARYLPDGSLDVSFAQNGRFSFNPPGPDGPPSIKLQQDGHLLLASNNRLIRLKPGGTIDSSFGTHGITTTGIHNPHLLRQPDGKLLLAGSRSAARFPVVLARYSSLGAPDASFGTGGVTEIPEQAGSGDHYTSVKMTLQPDGKIILLIGKTAGYQLFRVTEAGIPDPAFGNTGMVNQELPFQVEPFTVTAVAVQQDGTILTLGNLGEEIDQYNFEFYSFHQVPVIGRHLANGTLDQLPGSPNSPAIRFLRLGEHHDALNDLQLQADGKIVLCGYIGLGFKRNDPVLIRMKPDLQFDSSFGNKGIRAIAVYNEADALTNSLIYNNDLYVVGYAGYLGTLGIAMRVNLTNDNLPPSIRIVNPGNNQVFTAPARISFLAEATDPDSPIRNVFYFIGNRQVHKENKAPYTFNWQDVPPGNYTVMARAVDQYGKTSNSVPVTIIVKAPVAATLPAPAAMSLQLFPNPANSRLLVSLAGSGFNQLAEGAIAHASGAIVRRFRLSPQQAQLTLDISGLEKGLYVLTLGSANQRQSGTFIKQ